MSMLRLGDGIFLERYDSMPLASDVDESADCAQSAAASKILRISTLFSTIRRCAMFLGRHVGALVVKTAAINTTIVALAILLTRVSRNLAKVGSIDCVRMNISIRRMHETVLTHDLAPSLIESEVWIVVSGFFDARIAHV